MVPLSILDLCPIVEGGDAGQAFANTLELAAHAEAWGYRRYWLAEHHNMRGIASSATAVLIGRVAAATSTIRVGAGGIMLPNHAPLIVAEQFGTLARLFPGRIDLGLGRTTGGDPAAARALRRNHSGGEAFVQDLLELQLYFQPERPDQSVRAAPAAGVEVPLWILGSSAFSAQLAAHMGLPYAFASHFAPAELDAALSLYRAGFRPSPQLAAPRVMAAANVVAAETDAQARLLFSSLQQDLVNLRAGRAAPFPPPVEGFAETLPDEARTRLAAASACSIVGSPETVRAGLEQFIARTGADELILSSQIFDQAARLRSFELVAGLFEDDHGA
jgi:luciferase family oxidoreductase group 1